MVGKTFDGNIYTCCFIGCYIGYFIYIRTINHQRQELLDKYMNAIGGCEKGERHDSDVNNAGYGNLSPGFGQSQENTAFLNRVRKYIEDNLSNADANVDDMAAAAAVSRSTLNRRLRSCLGVSAAQLLIEARMKKAEQLIYGNDGNGYSIYDIARMCGYSDIHYFQRVFRKKTWLVVR